MMARKNYKEDNRVRIIAIVFLMIAFFIVIRLFILQIIKHEEYAFYALDAHEIYSRIHPERGEIFFQDSRTGEHFPAALNKDYFLIYAVPKEIAATAIKTTADTLGSVLGYNQEEQYRNLLEKLSKSASVYQVIEKKVPEDKIEQIKNSNLKGIYFTPQQFRYYPEGNLGGSVLGFASRNDQDVMVGKYGLEGYFDKELAGKTGFLSGERSAIGGWITLAGRKIIPAENGKDVVLTIDRTLEYYACKRLEEGFVAYKAKSAALVLMDSKTGAVRAMCSYPDFDPNNFSKVNSLENFNNTTIFTAYEPGSVFKPITMAMGIEMGLVAPDTTFTADPCKFEVGKGIPPIKNAENKCYPGAVTMTYVLQKSINTGMTWLVNKIGQERFKFYVEKFGFGDRTGLELNTEVPGTVSSLSQKVNMFYGSFGQGLTVTPLQLAVAYSALAHDGKLPKPYIVDEFRSRDGEVVKTTPQIVEQVVSSRTAKLVSGMLVSVVETTYTKTARLANYFAAGKTGTAQVSNKGKYDLYRTNHTFAGFAPANDPRLVLIVKYEEPQQQWAESTAAPVFKDVMEYALKYYSIKGDR